MNSKTEAILNVSIHRIQESIDPREVEESDNGKLNYKVNSLKLQLDNGDKDETVKTNSDDVPLKKTVSHIAQFNGTRRASSGSDLTISSSDSSSGVEIPWQTQMRNESVHQRPEGTKSGAQTVVYEEHQRSQWEWLGGSGLEASTDDSSSTPRDTFLRQPSDESSDIVIEKLKSEVASLSRQAEMSEVELQTLRKQIVKESKRGQDLFREVVCLRGERDVLKGECEKLKAKTKTNSHFEGGDSRAIFEELRQELNHAKELNANLRVQLEKTQESNSELILAVRDLDDMLEQKNKEIANLSSGLSSINEKLQEGGPAHQTYDDDDNNNDDDEQKALEELVKEHGDAKEIYLLEQQIMDMRSEIEIYKRDKDEIEMQMEQLALDYEIMKQENHEMAYRLEQSQIQEQLKMQYECSSAYASAHELEAQIENLENELKRRSKESEDALVKISELEAHIKGLEEDLEKQSQGFEADLEALMLSKVEQEQRAIRAEEKLRKTRWQNSNTAERIQEEFRRLSVQMASTFEANEKVVVKALAEANELRLEKRHLEEVVQKASDEHQSVKDSYEDRLNQLASEIEDKNMQLQHLKKHSEESEQQLSDEILKLKNEVEKCMVKNKIMSEDLESKEMLMRELEEMRVCVKEVESLVEKGNDERIELENKVMLVKSEAEESQKELSKMRSLLKEKELTVANLLSEMDTLRSEYTELKRSTSENELEKEELRKQVLLLKGDLEKTSKLVNRGSNDVANLAERIKLLEDHIKLKESALETSSNEFLEKEKDLLNKIEELEGRLEVLNQSSNHYYENGVEKVPVCRSTIDEDSSNLNSENSYEALEVEGSRNSAGNLDEPTNEMAFLKERNKLMEAELKEMQERYSEISLKFAEVEGERQQLVMKVRNLKNKKKS